MTPLERAVAEAWLIAAHELGVRVIVPVTLRGIGTSDVETPALVHDFGGPSGMVGLVLGEPSESIASYSGTEYRVSSVAPHYRLYRRGLFVETLNDWGYFGSTASRPDWYTGEPHGASAI
jgi:hypothetical protein